MVRRRVLTLLMVSLAPVPMATWGNHEQSHVGQNYLRSLFALGFQGFLILICVAIYAVLLQNVAISGDTLTPKGAGGGQGAFRYPEANGHKSSRFKDGG